MNRIEIETIIAKYRRFSNMLSSEHDEEDAHNVDHLADYLEENIEIFEDDSYETEEDILEDYKEIMEEFGMQWDIMFPIGDEDDSITDYLTDDD